MNARKLAVPLLAFAGGAILGRLLGFERLARGAMAAAAVTGMASRPTLLGRAARAAARARPRRLGPASAVRRRLTRKTRLF
jgi:hypothetical protein